MSRICSRPSLAHIWADESETLLLLLLQLKSVEFDDDVALLLSVAGLY